MSEAIQLQQQSRQKGETSKAHSAYIDYRDMGVNRSLRKLHNLYTAPDAPSDCPSKNLTTIEGWSSRNNWQDRIKEYEKHLYDQREQIMEKERHTERQKRTEMLEKYRTKIESQMFLANLNEDGIKAFEALTRAMKTYSDISMKHYNDLPTERKDLTSEGKSISVNFITEPVDQALVDARLQAMGLADYVDEQTE